MLQHYVARFASLQTNKNYTKWSEDTNYRAPHKPLLLLTVIDLFAQGKIVKNLIEPRADLVELFAEYWFWIMPSGLKGDLALPFFHLASDGFWHLVPKPGKERTVQFLRQAPSTPQMQDLILGSELDKLLFDSLRLERSRKLLGTTLVETYFSPSIQRWFFEQSFLQASPEESTASEEDVAPHFDFPDMQYSGEPQENVRLDQVNEQGIEILHLSVSVYNRLRRSGISTITKLLSVKSDELLNIKGLGERSLQKIQHALNEHHFENIEPPTNRPETAKDSEKSPERQSTYEPFASNLSYQKSGIISSENLNTEEMPPAWPREILEQVAAYQASIEILRLPRALYHALRRNGVTTVAALLSMSEDDLLAIRNLGERRKAILQAALKDFLLTNPLPPGVGIETDVNAPSQRIILPQSISTQRNNIEWSLVFQTLIDQVKAREIPLDRIPSQRLGLTSDLQALLAVHGTSVQEILEISQDDFMQLVKRHRKLLEVHCEHYLRECLSIDIWDPEIRNEGYSPVYRSLLSESTLRDLIFDWLAHLTERQRQIIINRYGLINGETQTLDEVGTSFGVTRERIRQLERGAFVKLRQMRIVIASLEAFAEQVFLIGPGIVHDDQWDAILAEMIDTRDIDVPSAMHLLLDVIDGIATYEKGQLSLWLGKRFDRAQLYSVLKSIRAKLNEKHAPIPLQKLRQSIISSDSNVIDNGITLTVLQTLFDAHEDFIVENDMVSLTSWEGRITDEIVMALQGIGEPAHYSEIAEAANKLLPSANQTTARNVHAHLGRYNNLFVRVGHGIFGLKEWGLPDDGNLANAVHRVLNEAGSPLHIDTITERVLATWHVQPISVYMAIANDDRFISIGSGVYWLKDLIAENGNSEKTVDFADLFSERLARWQEEIDQSTITSESNSFEEVEKIRNAGLDLFE